MPNDKLYMPLATATLAVATSSFSMSHNQTQDYLYHILPANMHGEILYPLNQIKDIYPDSYFQAVKKYQGREHLLSIRVDASGGLWNDHLFFSPIDPRVILKLQESMGCNVERMKDEQIIKIPSDRVYDKDVYIFDYQNALTAQNDPSVMNLETRKIKIPGFEMPNEISEAAINHWKEVCSRSEIPLFFSGIPHILVRGEVDIKDCEIFPIHRMPVSAPSLAL